MYRRYRPQSFQEVIGQDHVVAPLKAALAAGRTTHAYLFSGPRGCGKTTSARILARCLNCAQYPTDTPCGECESCRDLARDGSGSLDVVEMDAASHGGVDDARDLREQAGFAPVRDRFKIFIIDEAHMVSNQGFNALLKLVEEPPEHVKFIFATTEPDKVIGTIRSRTHHYPFRLVPPVDLEKYLARLCAMEGVSASKDVLNLVIRAGTGSVRDTLSVLDQIIGGSDSHSLDYDRAVALLGYTSAHLLDDAVSAIAQRDGAALFGVVDSVVTSGHDPRRFVEDLLQRLRDVVIIALTGQASRDIFVSVPDDQYARMDEQAKALGAPRASRCADITHEALNMMVGATSPRLQLELLCARLVVAQAESAGDRKTSAESAEPEGGRVSSPPPELAKWKKPATPQVELPADSSPARATYQPPVSQSEQGTLGHQPPVSPVVSPDSAKAETQVPPIPSMPASTAGMPAPSNAPIPAQSQPSTGGSPGRVDDSRTRDTQVADVENKPLVPPMIPRDLPDSAAVQARVATAGPASAVFDKIAGAWNNIVTHPHLGGLVRNQLHAGARPLIVQDNTLQIAFAMPAVAQRFNQRNSGTHVAAVIREILNIEISVTAVPDEGSTPPKAEAVLDQTPSPVQEYTADFENDEDERAVGVENPPAELATAVGTDPQEADVDPSGVLAGVVDRTIQLHGEDHIQVDQPQPQELPADHDEAMAPATPLAATPILTSPAPTPAPNDPQLSAPVPNAPVSSQSISATAGSEPDIPFFAEPMPDIPPLEYPGDTGNYGDTAPTPTPHSWVQHSVSVSTPKETPVEHNMPPVSSQPMPPPNPVPAMQPQRPWDTRPHHVVENNPGSQSEEFSEWEEVSEDDPDISESPLVGIRVLMDTFHATVIEEIPDNNGGE